VLRHAGTAEDRQDRADGVTAHSDVRKGRMQRVARPAAQYRARAVPGLLGGGFEGVGAGHGVSLF